MFDLDFLPTEYRQRNARRRMLVWRHAVSVGICFAVALASLFQHYARRNVLAQLAAISPQYDLACKQTETLNALQGQLREAQAEAELITYLRHPWPRTRLLAELLRPLPEEVVFTVLQIGRQQGGTDQRTAPRPPAEKPAENPAAAQAPCVQDLTTLRDESDHAKIVVTLEGLTSDIAALHRYLGLLNDGTLFANADLESLDAAQADGPAKVVRNDSTKVLHFVATLEVEPPYGLPGGPAGPPGSTPASSGPQKPPAMSMAETQKQKP